MAAQKRHGFFYSGQVQQLKLCYVYENFISRSGFEFFNSVLPRGAKAGPGVFFSGGDT